MVAIRLCLKYITWPFFRDTRVSRYQKGKTNLDFTEARDTEWQWHQLGHMQVCTSLQTDNHASTPPLSFLQAGCPSCRPTNSVNIIIIIIVISGDQRKTSFLLQCLSMIVQRFNSALIVDSFSSTDEDPDL